MYKLFSLSEFSNVKFYYAVLLSGCKFLIAVIISLFAFSFGTPLGSSMRQTAPAIGSLLVLNLILASINCQLQKSPTSYYYCCSDCESNFGRHVHVDLHGTSSMFTFANFTTVDFSDWKSPLMMRLALRAAVAPLEIQGLFQPFNLIFISCHFIDLVKEHFSSFWLLRMQVNDDT